MYTHYIIIFILMVSSSLRSMEAHYSLCPESGILGSEPPARYIPNDFVLTDEQTHYEAQGSIINECPFLGCHYYACCCHDLEEHIATRHVQLYCIICLGMGNSDDKRTFFSLKDFFDHTNEHSEKELRPDLAQMRKQLLKGSQSVTNYLKSNYHLLKSKWIQALLKVPMTDYEKEKIVLTS